MSFKFPQFGITEQGVFTLKSFTRVFLKSSEITTIWSELFAIFFLCNCKIYQLILQF